MRCHPSIVLINCAAGAEVFEPYGFLVVVVAIVVDVLHGDAERGRGRDVAGHVHLRGIVGHVDASSGTLLTTNYFVFVASVVVYRIHLPF